MLLSSQLLRLVSRLMTLFQQLALHAYLLICHVLFELLQHDPHSHLLKQMQSKSCSSLLKNFQLVKYRLRYYCLLHFSVKILVGYLCTQDVEPLEPLVRQFLLQFVRLFFRVLLSRYRVLLIQL